jgi:hypothetical protein
MCVRCWRAVRFAVRSSILSDSARSQSSNSRGRTIFRKALWVESSTRNEVKKRPHVESHRRFMSTPWSGEPPEMITEPKSS